MTATVGYRTAGRSKRSGHDRSRQRRQGRRVGPVLAALLVLSLLIGAGWLVGFSEVLSARRVAITGLVRVDAASIRAAAAVPLGLPLARQDLVAIASRVSSLPKIESAEVSRQWPHTIRIAVVERRPLLAIRQPEGFILVDTKGVAFDSSPTLPPGVLQADVSPDRTSLLAEVGAIADAMPPALKSKVAGLHATSHNQVTVQLTDGVTINWGTAADSVLKSELVLVLSKRKPSTIDVSSPHNPAIR